MLSTIVSAAAAALTVPLTPAPARQIPPCAVYRYYPAGSDGMKGSAVFTVRVFASTVEEAAAEADDECDYGLVCTKSRNYDEEIFYSHMRVITDLGCWRTECV